MDLLEKMPHRYAGGDLHGNMKNPVHIGMVWRGCGGRELKKRVRESYNWVAN